MTSMKEIEQLIASLDNTGHLLYSCPDNPYESIYIRAKISEGSLTITDEESEHAPGGGSSLEELKFDTMNTQKVFLFLLEIDPNPYLALSSMMSYMQRTKVFQAACQVRSIQFQKKLFL
ncbi:MAG: hypothetical protein IK127_02055 [Clostridia bacterium]|nr:hypothetical protein [Clostridia bacterium]